MKWFRIKHAVVTGVVVGLIWLLPAETLLVVHEKQFVDSWSVENGVWKKLGTFGDCVEPMSVAVLGREVMVGTFSGKIYRYSPDGKQLGLFADHGARCDAMTVSPDGKTLYSATAFDAALCRVGRYTINGKHNPNYITEALSTPRSLQFGADGFLYAANRGGTISVFDVSGEKSKLVASIPNGGTAGGLLVQGVKLWMPNGRWLKSLDLATAKIAKKVSGFENCFVSCEVADKACFADYSGRVQALTDKGLCEVAQLGEKVSCIARLSATLDGTVAKKYMEYKAVLKGKKLTYAYPENYVGDFVSLPYNNEGTMYLKTGLICFPMVMDYDGDGDQDLVVSNGGIPSWAGTFYFENPGTAAKGEIPVYKPAKKIGPARSYIASKTLPSGKVAVTYNNQIARDFTKTGFAGFETLKGLPPNIHYNGVRCNMWRLVDFDGDGWDDLVVGVGDWTQYGWHNAYDNRGNWKNGQIHGLLYWIRNEGKGDEEKWGTPQLIRLENQVPMETFGGPVAMFEDWDGDGDLDVVAADFLDNFTYFENIGTRTKPVYTTGRLLRKADGSRLHADLCIVSPVAVDLNQDGKLDFIAGEEDGRVGFYRNTGKIVDRIPVFEEPVFLRQEREYVHFGVLSTPAGVDWDGDGDWDIIAGNSAGYVCFIENLSGPGVASPKWAEPKLLNSVGTPTPVANPNCRIDANPIRIWAGHNGSIQGPAEAQWGYTCLSVADWDGDGLPDVMVNTIWGDPLWFKNVGTRTKPQLGPAQDVIVEWEGEQPTLAWGWYKPKFKYNPKALLTQWRTSPVMFDWTGDGLTDLIMVDQEGYLCLFERAKVDGKLILKAPKRVFMDERGEELHPTAKANSKAWIGGVAGASGRRKICVVDWDGDGKLDLVMNSVNATWFRQVKAENGKWYFKNEGNMGERVLAGHTTCPTSVDFDADGVPEILLGTEDGFFYTLQNERSAK